MGIWEGFRQPWPWYVAGPLIGLPVPLLLSNKAFGISSNLRHICAMLPGSRRIGFFNYNRRKEAWNLVFGFLVGGFVGGVLLASPEPLQVAASAPRDLAALGVAADGAPEPRDLFSWSGLLTLPGFLLMVGGGFLVGCGAHYAGSCTSGHAISGLLNLQLPSLVAVLGFFIGGLISTYLLLPFTLGV